jgi:hypothetical protein
MMWKMIRRGTSEAVPEYKVTGKIPGEGCGEQLSCRFRAIMSKSA